MGVEGLSQRGRGPLVESVGVESSDFGAQSPGHRGDDELESGVETGGPNRSERHGSQGTHGTAPEPTGSAATVAAVGQL